MKDALGGLFLLTYGQRKLKWREQGNALIELGQRPGLVLTNALVVAEWPGYGRLSNLTGCGVKIGNDPTNYTALYAWRKALPLPRERSRSLKWNAAAKPEGEATDSIAIAIAVIFLSPFSAQKSHVKPPNPPKTRQPAHNKPNRVLANLAV